MHRNWRLAFVASLVFLGLLQTPSLAVKMYTSSRESSTKARDLASPVQQAQRDLTDDNKNIERKEAEDEEARQRKKAAMMTRSRQENPFGYDSSAGVGGRRRPSPIITSMSMARRASTARICQRAVWRMM